MSGNNSNAYLLFVENSSREKDFCKVLQNIYVCMFQNRVIVSDTLTK